MSLVINTNTASLNAQRQILLSGNELDKATARLSSGKRINSAADDAAGLAISNRMTSQVRGLNQAIRNANDGVSLIQVAEGALNETGNMLQRIRELSVQAANGIYSNGDRATLNAEVKQLLAQVDLIAKNTEFNGQPLLNGQTQKIDLQIGAAANQTINVDIPKMDTKSLGMGSTSGDLTGAEINVSNSGVLASSIPSDAIKINGKSLPAAVAGTKVQDFIDSINKNVNNVEASSAVILRTDSIGNGVLKGGANIVISGVNLNGTTSSFSITGTTSLAELAQNITDKTAGIVQGSIDDNGKLVLTSAGMSTMTVVDSTGGTATGASLGSNSDPNIANIVNALQTSWISESEGLIDTYFGMIGDNVDITLNLIPIGDPQSDGAAGKIAWVAWSQSGNRGINLSLNLDMADFTPANLPNGNLVAGIIYSDRVVAHEMVHAVMTRNVDMSGLPGWFKEGAAEFIQGADERVKNDLASLPNQAAFTVAFAAAAVANPAALGYTVGYLAVKMMHAEIKNAGGAGISEVFDALQGGSTFDQALQTVSAAHGMGGLWNNLATFNTHVNTQGYNFMNGTYLPGVVNLDLTPTELDTGSVAGSDFGGGAKTNVSIIPDAANMGPQHFNLIVPAQYGGGTLTADAQLILTSKTGEPINITKGKSGTDDILKSIGFVETSSKEVIGNTLNAADQAKALASGDLKINGVEIGSSLAADGLVGKVAAINSHTEQTGVKASSLAKVSFSTNSTAQKEYVGATVTNVLANDVIGINGIGIAITAGQTMQTVAGNINAAYASTGAKAYADDTGRLHIFSENPLNFSHSNVTAPTAGFFNDIGWAADNTTTGSINIKGIDVALTNIYDKTTLLADINAKQAQTGVYAKIDDNGQLQFDSASAFNLKLGNTNGFKTFSALGISTGFTAGATNLSDTNSDNQLKDERVDVLARLQLTSINDSAIQINLTTNGATATGLVQQNLQADTASGSSLSSLNVLTAASAQKAIKVVDNALTTINGVRSTLGAVNNRLDFTISNLSNVVEKTIAALSRIVDTDFAQETAKLSRSNVIQLAAQAMLAQANSRPSQVLSLLR
jgi:flagellin-like hook-associated protein FlgL